jgi:hypothetical protein
VLEYKIDCDFKAMYGDAFVLNDIEPERFIAEGSSVGIWKRNRLNHERS